MTFSSHGTKVRVEPDQILQDHLQMDLIRGLWKPAEGLKLESDMIRLAL